MVAYKARILTGHWLVVAVLAMSGVAAFALVPGTFDDVVPVERILRDLPNPARASADLPPASPRDDHYYQEERIRRGDTLGSVFARLGVDDPEALAFVRLDPSARALYRLRPGRALRVETDAEGRLVALRFATDSGSVVAIERSGDAFSTASTPPPVDVRWETASAEIHSSLFAAADAAGLPDAVMIALANVFAADIDFHHDLRGGDRFSVVYEMRYLDGEPIGAGRIVAAEFHNRDRTLRAFLWRGGNGADAYYSESGAPLRKAFLRSPMEFSRVTSGFSDARFHPILQSWHAHKGVDFAAPTGTPVVATGGGKVVSAGWQSGYGNVIHVQHQGAFSTVYAHLSRFASQVRRGAHVAQGEVIGYVGQTGWATGPHLHYEFRVGTEQRDPLHVGLPKAEPLSPGERRAFLAEIEPATARLGMARSPSSTALAAAR